MQKYSNECVKHLTLCINHRREKKIVHSSETVYVAVSIKTHNQVEVCDLRLILRKK